MQLYQQNNAIPRIFQDNFPLATVQKQRKSNWFITNPSNHDDQNAERAKYVVYSAYLEMYLEKVYTP